MLNYYKVINMDYRTLLNENQYKAVSTDKQYVRVIAGAGSGKTRVLTYRLSYLISEMGVDPFSIVAIAFTNKVAQEMKQRALSLLGPEASGLSVSTFHSFCARFLRKEIDVLGFPNNFTIMDEEDTTTLIKNIGVEKGYKKNDEIVKYAISYISYNKCNGIFPDDIKVSSLHNELEKKALVFYHEYEERKEAMLSLDFDDLLLKTIKILEEYQEVREKWQRRITNILVDEFQDTNDIQFKLIKLLMNYRTSLYVVGDPDQTIYTWRGANQNIIMDFPKTFPNVETIILDRNYRSTKAILDCANKLISHNKKRVPKALYTENNNGEKVSLNILYSRDQEAKFVIDQIEQLHLKGVQYKDIVILYRAAYLTLPFENELMKRRIPYQIYGGLKFFQRKEIKDVLAYFRLLYNPKDDISFERIINVPRRGIGDSSMDILKAEKNANGMSYLEYLDEIENRSTMLKPKMVLALAILIDKIKITRSKLDENLEAYSKILEDFLMDIGYYDYLKSDDETAEERLGNVKALFENINSFMKENPESSFDEYLQNATLQTSQDEIVDNNQVSLMTIHVAKGLEFDYVFVVSLIDGVFPSQRTLDESGHDGLEEERRLCYVAFTRAKKKLFVTANTSYSFVLSQEGKQSAFINEAGLIRENNSAYKGAYKKPNSIGYFMDEQTSFDDFFTSKKEEKKENGISDWKVGDIAIHDVFGRGVVTAVMDDLVEINFDNHGTKTLMSNHIKLHREKRGIEA